MSKYIELSRVLMYIADIQLSVSDASKPTIAPRDLCEWIFEGIKDLPTIELSVEELRKKYKDFYEQGKFDALVEVSEDNKAYTYCSRCGMRVVVETPSVTTEQSSIVGERIEE